MEVNMLLIGFLLGCLFTYFVLFRPVMKSCKEYERKLEKRLEEAIGRQDETHEE